MSGVEIVQVAAYVAVAVFLAAMARRVIRYVSTPTHLRWELYPVPHEGGREGSYFEELDWWEKPRHSSMIGELRRMIIPPPEPEAGPDPVPKLAVTQNSRTVGAMSSIRTPGLPP